MASVPRLYSLEVAWGVVSIGVLFNWTWDLCGIDVGLWQLRKTPIEPNPKVAVWYRQSHWASCTSDKPGEFPRPSRTCRHGEALMHDREHWIIGDGRPNRHIRCMVRNEDPGSRIEKLACQAGSESYIYLVLCVCVTIRWWCLTVNGNVKLSWQAKQPASLISHNNHGFYPGNRHDSGRKQP